MAGGGQSSDAALRSVWNICMVVRFAKKDWNFVLAVFYLKLGARCFSRVSPGDDFSLTGLGLL
jgi:hypothetical protein